MHFYCWLGEKSTEFPDNSLVLKQNLHIWAEFDDFEIEFEKSPVILPVLPVIRLLESAWANSNRRAQTL